MSERNSFKDACAWTLIYGGTALAKLTIATAAVAAGFISRAQSRAMLRATSRVTSLVQGQAWSIYKNTGSIGKAIDHLL